MNILLINYEFPPLGGGGGAFCKDLSLELAKKHNVDILTSLYPGLAKEEKIENINIYRVPVISRKSLYFASIPSMVSFPLPALLKGLSLVKKKAYSIINTHFAVPTGPAGLTLSQITKVPNIVSAHGSDIYNPATKYSPHKNKLLKWTVKNVLSQANSIIAQSNDMRSYIEKFYCSAQKVKIIPLGLPDISIAEFQNNYFTIRERGLNLISIGRMAKVKGYDFLIKAIALLVKKIPDIKLKLVGDGPERMYLENLTRELGLSDRIKFTGWLSGLDKYNELIDSDIYVMSSLHEGFGVVLLEAMACGLPLIATNTGGQADIIENDINGFLVNSSTEKELAKSIYSLAIDKQKRKIFSFNNKRDIKKYKMSTVANRYTEIFQATVAQSKKT